nr:MAG TPA: hypothetical protein [Caudoviricetes sp.]
MTFLFYTYKRLYNICNIKNFCLIIDAAGEQNENKRLKPKSK